VLLPVFLILVFGMIEFGKAINYWIDLTHLANEGARFASVNHWPDCPANNTIDCGGTNPGEELDQYLAGQANTNELATGTTPSGDPSPYVTGGLFVDVCYPQTQTTVGNPVKVIVGTTYRFPIVDGLLSAIGLGGVAEVEMRVSSTMRIEREPARIGTEDVSDGTLGACS
jgi:hypothetical protein